MSRETSNWLNNNVLIGFTSKRGNAWHYKASEQGDEPNHYEMGVPAADVLRRLFNFQAIELPIYVQAPCTIEEADSMDADGRPVRFVAAPGRKAIVADDNYDVLGLFKDGYQPHQYSQWLLDNVCNLLQDSRDGLAIGSAGLLKNRGQAWVSIEVPESITTPEGVEFRPNLIAATSFDGSMATTYKRVVQAVVCDNTLEAGLSEKGQQIKVKHSRYSQLKLEDAQAALAVVHETADDFAAEVKRLCEIEVSQAQWRKLIDHLVPIEGTTGRGQTMANNKRSSLKNLYAHDQRVEPWAGTAFGVLQAFNTYSHHVQGVRGAHRVERNMSEVLSGRFASNDQDVLSALALVSA